MRPERLEGKTGRGRGGLEDGAGPRKSLGRHRPTGPVERFPAPDRGMFFWTEVHRSTPFLPPPVGEVSRVKRGDQGTGVRVHWDAGGREGGPPGVLLASEVGRPAKGECLRKDRGDDDRGGDQGALSDRTGRTTSCFGERGHRGLGVDHWSRETENERRGGRGPTCGGGRREDRGRRDRGTETTQRSTLDQ